MRIVLIGFATPVLAAGIFFIASGAVQAAPVDPCKLVHPMPLFGCYNAKHGDFFSTTVKYCKGPNLPPDSVIVVTYTAPAAQGTSITHDHLQLAPGASITWQGVELPGACKAHQGGKP